MTTTEQSPTPCPHIAVYILEDIQKARGEIVRCFFDHPAFQTYLVTIETPEDWLRRHPYLKKEEAQELYAYQWCLADAKRRMPDGYTLIVKDSSTTNLKAGDMATAVLTAIHEKNWDVCYLSRWLDRCDLYTDQVKLPGTGTLLVKTYSPYGCQAILFSPSGRDIVIGEQKLKDGGQFKVSTSLSDTLNKAIRQGQLEARCFSPNLMSLDLGVISENTDFSQYQECRAPDPVITNGNSFWFWFLFILIIIGVVWLVCDSRRRGYVFI